MKSKVPMTMAAAMALLGAGAHAAVSADEAKQLGGDRLTVFGAEKAGNKEGTIPPYTGKPIKAPAGYDAQNEPGQRVDPYGEKPLFSITAQNADQYASKLDGMVEIFKRYPNYRMDIYPTHRDFVYPQYVLDNTIKNATACKTTNGELKLEGCYGGWPFPVPKTGYEVMWNHMLQYRGMTYQSNVTNFITPPNGVGVLQSNTIAYQQYEYYNPMSTTPNPSNQIYWKVFQNNIGPARKAGDLVIILDSLDMVDVGRRAYQYITGQRRVKLAPNLAYDTPSPNTGGGSTMDDVKGFAGGMDRYDFKLVGKKEKYIMYNNYGLNNVKMCTDDKVINNANFPHPDCVRWELHRVWVVEAILKPSFRHIYAKRTFFWDEDAPGGGAAEAYDQSGKLYRVMNQSTIPWYDGQGGMTDTTYGMDLLTGAWNVQGSGNFKTGGSFAIPPKDDRYFSPEAMTAAGVR